MVWSIYIVIFLFRSCNLVDEVGRYFWMCMDNVCVILSIGVVR